VNDRSGSGELSSNIETIILGTRLLVRFWYSLHFHIQLPAHLGSPGKRAIKRVFHIHILWWDAGVVICLERGADLYIAHLMPLPLTVSCFSKIQIGFTFLVPAHLGSPGKRAVKRVCLCVCALSYPDAVDSRSFDLQVRNFIVRLQFIYVDCHASLPCSYQWQLNACDIAVIVDLVFENFPCMETA